jgi:hypothetical protein
VSRRPRVYGWKATKLCDLSFEELNELREMVVNDPKSANPDHARGSIYLYTREANRKLDALAWAVTYKLAEQRRQKTDS